jgi:GntR family transcriptional regulator
LCQSGLRFHIQQDSDIPASSQLYNQICFAIAARHFPPGHRLPSTRQLAMQTGLHRNTISKVYRQLENDGVVEAMAAPCSKPATCSPARSTGACAAAPACW